MKSNNTSSPPKNATSASEFVPKPLDATKAVRRLFPEAEAARALGGAAQAPVAQAARESAFDAGGIEIADIGARLRWVDESKCEDNPFQTREEYDDEPDGHIQSLMESLNRVGQLQPGIARPHPDKNKREAGWVQVGAGHSRLRAVREGGNAGTNLPEAQRFRGKLLFLVRELNDIEMAVIAIEENENRKDPNPIERAKGYLRLKELLDEKGQGSTWKAFAESRGVTYERLRQLARLLELPEKVKKSIAQGWWNEKHGRAVLSLREEPKLQEMLIRQIGNEQLSGNAAAKRASDLMANIPNQTRMNMEAAVAREQENAAMRSAEAAQEENRAALDNGTARLRIVGKGSGGSGGKGSGGSGGGGGGGGGGGSKGDSEPNAADDARKMREAVTELVPGAGDSKTPEGAVVNDTLDRLRHAAFAIGMAYKEIKGGEFQEKAELLELCNHLVQGIDRAAVANAPEFTPTEAEESARVH